MNDLELKTAKGGRGPHKEFIPKVPLTFLG